MKKYKTKIPLGLTMTGAEVVVRILPTGSILSWDSYCYKAIGLVFVKEDVENNPDVFELVVEEGK